MEFYDVVKNRRTVREWSDKEVSEQSIRRIIEAGLAAPSNNHLREWDFIVLHSDAEKDVALKFVKEWSLKQEVSKLTMTGITPAQRMYQYAMPRQYTMLSQAPYVIMPVFKAGDHLYQASSVNQLNSFASIWCVIENIFLAATAEGMAYSMRIPVGEEGKNVATALSVPTGYIIPCYIGIGYPSDTCKQIEQITYTADQKMHFGKW